MNKKNPFAPVVDPVCKMQVLPMKAAANYTYKGTRYYFCNVKCKEKFTSDPELYLTGKAPAAACCCCNEAFESNEDKISANLKKLRNGFIVSAVITVVIIALNHCGCFNLTVKNYMQFLLAALAVFGPGGFLLRRGVESLIKRQLNMFTLISMGISAAYFYSVYALFFASTLPPSLLDSNGGAKLHFAPAAMITALVILGQYLEGRAASGAGKAIRSLMEQLPPTARRIKKCCGTVEIIELDKVQPGDTLQILPHDKIPVDGIVIEGVGSVDESMLTGESLRIAKTAGSKLAAGTLNGETLLVMQANAIGKDTLLAHIIELVRNARNARLPIRKLADKVSAIFVPVVLAVALVSLIYWGFIAGNWSMALGNFIAVLLAACPCSLGLAAPLAVMTGVGVGARHGILIKDPSVLENLRKVDTLMLDKTGTLTENKPLVKNIILNDNVKPEEFFTVLLALEHCSNHPLAQAVCSIEQAQKYKWQDLTVDYFTSIPGQGVQGCVDDILYYLGSADFLRQNNIDISDFLKKNSVDPDSGTLLLADRKRVLGLVAVGDKLRPDALPVITALKLNNIDPVILSGDSEGAVKSVAYQLGIKEFYSRLSPQGKLEKIKNRQAFGRCVAMLGDGVNDAAALAAADVSVAMGSGTNAALENSGVTLLAGNIGKMAQLLQLAQAVNNTIKFNLILAFAYNIILIPMAAGAFYSLTEWQFSPIAGSIAMSGSCLLVVFNSLKLWKLKLN